MDVSVIIPTRNRSALLAITLHSVLRQRDVDLEVIVVDEASSDDTPAVIARFADSRVRVIRHDRCLGVSVARNRGIAEAAAEWIAFLDDDDVWAPEKLALQLRAARETGAVWVYVGHVNITMRHMVTGGARPLDPEAVLQQLPQSDVVPGGCSGVMVSKRALAVVGEFDSRYQSLADWDLWLRLARAGTPAWVPRPLVAYRMHGDQMSLNASRIQAEFRTFAASNRQANWALLYRYLGWWTLRVRKYRAALQFFLRAALQRRAEYPGGVFAEDLAALAQEVLNRLRISRVRIARAPHLSEEDRSWRNEAQIWVDELVAAANAARQGRGTFE